MFRKLVVRLSVLSVICLCYCNGLQTRQDISAVYFPSNINEDYSSFLSNGSVYSTIRPQGSKPLVNQPEVLKPQGNIASGIQPAPYNVYQEESISAAINKFTLATNRILSSNLKNENIVFSPLCIATSLALVLLGSNGLTYQELVNLLGTAGIKNADGQAELIHDQTARLLREITSPSNNDNGAEINSATGIFIQSGYMVRPLYKSTAKQLYNSDIEDVDFKRDSYSAQTLINNWISSKTKGKISYILSDAPSTETRVILASALYFKDEWEQHFFPDSTTRKPFFVNGRKSPTNIETDMMANGGMFPYYKDVELGCEILGLPYKGKRNIMYIVMPFNSSINRLKEFASILTPYDLERLASRTAPTDSVILFPKMRIESTIDLQGTLQSLGIKSLFNPHLANLALLSSPESSTEGAVQATRALPVVSQSVLLKNLFNSRSLATNLDNLRQVINQQSTDNRYLNPGLYADNVIHKVFIDITETGTEAAAATAVSLTKGGDKITFRVDVPFIFFIRNEETKTILFWGSVYVPTPSYSTATYQSRFGI